MAIEVLVLKETAPGERRVAATPETVKKLVAKGASIKIESGAGRSAGFVDQAYFDAGAQLATADTPTQDVCAITTARTSISACVSAASGRSSRLLYSSMAQRQRIGM